MKKQSSKWCQPTFKVYKLQHPIKCVGHRISASNNPDGHTGARGHNTTFEQKAVDECEDAEQTGLQL